MQIEYSKSAFKAIQKYDIQTKQRIKIGLEKLLSVPPEGDIKPLKGYNDDRMRLRIGKYRIIFRFDKRGNIEILYVMEIDSRGDIYK